MDYDFDSEIPREGTNSVKWEFAQEGENMLAFARTDRFFGEDRALPMWVADMDFRCPEPVVKALIARAEHGIFGYTAPTESFYASVVAWMKRRHGWDVDPDWITVCPGVVPALNVSVQAFSSPGGKVLMQPPVYYPFFMAAESNRAEVAANPLLYRGGRYYMDFEGLESVVSDPNVTMAILCSPHNPVGRVWSRDELARYADTCLRNDVLMVADEVHGDLVYDDHAFTPLASMGSNVAGRSIVCVAPSKTFNMAGLQTSCVIIADDELRVRFRRSLVANGLFGVGSFGVVALQAAYDHGEEWLGQVKAYIAANLAFLEDFVEQHVPGISVVRPEGTYLVWLDCRGLGLDGAALRRLMIEEARVYLDDGFIFGSEGEGFERINIACPRSLLADALGRIKAAVDDLH